MVLRNYVELVAGQPSRLHFVSADLVDRTITDPVLGRPKVATVLMLGIDELDGQPAAAFLSVTAEKLASQFKPFIDRGVLADYDFVVTARGEGFRRTYSVEPIARTPRR
jgi:predicted methyltransferase